MADFIRDLESVIEDPLKLFDALNQIVWKNIDEPKTKDFIDKVRTNIENTPFRSMKYMEVYLYMSALKARAEGKHKLINDIVDMLKEDYIDKEKYT